LDTVGMILFLIPILNTSEASIQGKRVDNIHIHVRANYSKVLVLLGRLSALTGLMR